MVKEHVTTKSFLSFLYKVHFQADIIKESMITPIRRDAGLSDPPKEYTNNDVEAGNFMIRYALEFDAKKSNEFIESVRDLICLQYRNEERAILGIGPYRISPRFKALEIPESNWTTLTHQQRMSMLEKFKNAGMDSAKSLVDEPIGQKELRSTLKLSIAPENSGIKTVPMPVLQIMFEKAKCLSQTKCLVVPKPGATDGSYIVAGNANNAYAVTTGKGNSLQCDRACLNAKSKICEHVLAVAEHIGLLYKFLKWFTSSKSGPSFPSIALVTAKQNVGKEGSKRKRSNMVKPPVVEVCDIINTSPDEDILPSSNGLSAIKRTKA